VKRNTRFSGRPFVNLQSGIDRSSQPINPGAFFMTSSRFAFAVGALALLSAPASAQTAGQANALRQDAPVRFQSSISFFVPGPSGDGEEAQRLRDKARRAIYEMAARECDLVREIIARECRMETVNINIGRQSYGSHQPEGYTVNGSMNLQVFLK
jgi:hypothetical protein